MINSTKFVNRVIAEITPGQNSMAMISITEPFTAFGIAKLKDGWHSVLRLEFHDIEIPVFDAPYVLSLIHILCQEATSVQKRV